MKRYVLIGALLAGIVAVSLASCHSKPDQTAVINAQQQALAQQQQVISQLQQGAAAVAPVAQVGSPAVVAPAPIIVQQPAVVNNGDNGVFTGMVLGHLLSNGGNGGSHTTVVNHYRTSNTTVSAPRIVQPVRRSYFAASTTRSYSTPRSSYTSRSSYSSGARSSFSSSRSFGRR